MSQGYLGRGGRLEGGPADELVDGAFAVEVEAGPRLADSLSAADLAHAIALAEAGALSAATAATLLEGLLALEEIPPEEFPWRPELGDAFNSREAALRERVGREAAGWLSAGRPRREAFRVALRLVARDAALDLHDVSLGLAGAVVALARPLADAVAADYTYLQPAQPTTAGHLLLAYAEPAARDAERFRAVHARLSRSVAGVGGSAGSRWPLDRERLAALLGCEGLEVHAKDAMWQADAYLELASATAIAVTGWSQLCQDLEILASQEFGWVELADRHSRASALMPQKKNPYALAAVRAEAGAATGQLVSMLVALHTGSARTDHFHLLNGELPRALDRTIAVGRLLIAVVEGMTVDAARMERAAREGFVTAADLSDVLAQQPGMDYRTAHTVVGRAGRELVAAGAAPDTIDAGRLAEIAREVAGVEITLSAADLADALDPAACARRRLQRGSSAPGEVARMLDDREASVTAGLAWSAGSRERARAAALALRERARSLSREG